MLRPPPPSTLFPYTTLFRSVLLAEVRGHVDEARAVRGRDVGRGDDGERPAAPIREVVEEDRKSTRLNSCHLVISYAVFCLKKKNNKQQEVRSEHTAQSAGVE